MVVCALVDDCQTQERNLLLQAHVGLQVADSEICTQNFMTHLAVQNAAKHCAAELADVRCQSQSNASEEEIRHTRENCTIGAFSRAFSTTTKRSDLLASFET